MSESTTGAYEPGTYVKGDQVREAKDSRAAVRLVFDGFHKQTEEEVEKLADLDAEKLAEDLSQVTGDSIAASAPSPADIAKKGKDA